MAASAATKAARSAAFAAASFPRGFFAPLNTLFDRRLYTSKSARSRAFASRSLSKASSAARNLASSPPFCGTGTGAATESAPVVKRRRAASARRNWAFTSSRAEVLGLTLSQFRLGSFALLVAFFREVLDGFEFLLDGGDLFFGLDLDVVDRFLHCRCFIGLCVLLELRQRPLGAVLDRIDRLTQLPFGLCSRFLGRVSGVERRVALPLQRFYQFIVIRGVARGARGQRVAQDFEFFLRCGWRAPRRRPGPCCCGDCCAWRERLCFGWLSCLGQQLFCLSGGCAQGLVKIDGERLQEASDLAQACGSACAKSRPEK